METTVEKQEKIKTLKRHAYDLSIQIAALEAEKAAITYTILKEEREIRNALKSSYDPLSEGSDGAFGKREL